MRMDFTELVKLLRQWLEDSIVRRDVLEQESLDDFTMGKLTEIDTEINYLEHLLKLLEE